MNSLHSIGLFEVELVEGIKALVTTTAIRRVGFMIPKTRLDCPERSLEGLSRL